MGWDLARVLVFSSEIRLVSAEFSQKSSFLYLNWKCRPTDGWVQQQRNGLCCDGGGWLHCTSVVSPSGLSIAEIRMKKVPVLADIRITKSPILKNPLFRAVLGITSFSGRLPLNCA